MAQLKRAYELAFSRQPEDDELRYAQEFVARHGLTQFCLVLFNASEFHFID